MKAWLRRNNPFVSRQALIDRQRAALQLGENFVGGGAGGVHRSGDADDPFAIHSRDARVALA